MILSFISQNRIHFKTRKNPRFPGFLFSATQNPGFKILSRIGNTNQRPPWKNFLDIVLKNWTPLRKLFVPPGLPVWLRVWYLPTLLHHIHLHSFILHNKQGTKQYVYKSGWKPEMCWNVLLITTYSKPNLVLLCNHYNKNIIIKKISYICEST